MTATRPVMTSLPSPSSTSSPNHYIIVGGDSTLLQTNCRAKGSHFRPISDQFVKIRRIGIAPGTAPVYASSAWKRQSETNFGASGETTLGQVRRVARFASLPLCSGMTAWLWYGRAAPSNNISQNEVSHPVDVG